MREASDSDARQPKFTSTRFNRLSFGTTVTAQSSSGLGAKSLKVLLQAKLGSSQKLVSFILPPFLSYGHLL